MDEKVLVTCDSGLKLCTFACKTTICCVSSAGKTEQRRLLLKTTQCPFGLCTLCYVITCNLNSGAFWLETPKTIIWNPVFRYPKCLGVQTVSFSSGTSQQIRKSAPGATWSTGPRCTRSSAGTWLEPRRPNTRSIGRRPAELALQAALSGFWSLVRPISTMSASLRTLTGACCHQPTLTHSHCTTQIVFNRVEAERFHCEAKECHEKENSSRTTFNLRRRGGKGGRGTLLITLIRLSTR